MNKLKRLLAGLTLLMVFAAATAWGQTVPKMRTRKFTSMTNAEVEEYLKRNNNIIIPIGPVEMHGLMPLEAEYIGPLGWSLKMAEKADALVFPHFVFDYPGGTTSGRGTFYMSVLESSALLERICESLIRQGFRKFFFVTGHGPALHTTYPVARELYEKYGVPAFDCGVLFSEAQEKVREAGGKTDKTFYGLYQIAGQLEDIPLGVTLPRRQQPPMAPAAAAQGKGGRAGAPQPADGSTALHLGMGNIYVEPEEHSWSPDQPLTEELRAQYAKEGVAQVDQVIAQLDIALALRRMNEQIKIYNEVLIPRFGDLLNFKKYDK